MRIATYNIWNCASSNELRFDQIIGEILKINADVIGLQEVPDKKYHDDLLNKCRFKYGVFLPHSVEGEGLSVFSQYPILHSTYFQCAVTALLQLGNTSVSITNLHLDWKSPLKRERDIIALEKHASSVEADYKLMLGDFNCSVNSGVHQYLLGQSSLLGEEVDMCWYDLADSYSDISQENPENTIDFKNNPRWQGKNTIEKNMRFDRILLQNTYPKEFPVLTDCIVFGKDVSPATNMTSSDHYGVYVDIEL